jgi:signal transduction histidine kinase/ActR/RegA family two-component response regulator/Tfp pilus assembly protein PilF
MFLFSGICQAQKQGVDLLDSLKQKLETLKEDTSKVRLLGKLSFQYYRYNTDTGILYAEQAISLSKKIKWDLGLAFSYNYLATNYAVKGVIYKALELFHLSLLKYREIGDKQGEAFILNNIGNLYRMQKDFPMALYYLHKAIPINDSLNSQVELSKVYNNLGFVYNSKSDYNKSNEYYYKALKINQGKENQELAAQIQINIAENKVAQKDYCGAIEYATQALRTSEELKIDYDIAIYSCVLGTVFLRFADDSNIRSVKCDYFKSEKAANLIIARNYILTAEQMLEKIGDMMDISDNALLLSEVYEKLDDHRNALKYYKIYSSNKDSVFSQGNSIKIANIEKQQELALRDDKIKIQQLEIKQKDSQNTVQIVLFILFLAFTFFTLYLYYTNKTNKVRKQNERELILAKEKAEESDRLKSAFLANLSHEIRTPMNGIMGFAELLKTPDLFKEQQHKYIDLIETSGKRMLNIINDIVSISKIESGQVEVKYTKTNINQKIDEVYSLFSFDAGKKGIQLRLQKTLPEKEAIILTDCEKIEIILGHLIKNAIKFTDSGVVELGYELRQEQEGPFLEFFVKDTGIGIPKDRQEAIFARFIQADIADKNAYQGAGLGLSISKAYVEMLNGKIWVDSNEGKGSMFLFKIPYQKDNEGVNIPKHAENNISMEGELKKIKLLVVEDDYTSDFLITKSLQDYSREILHAKTGIEAVDLARNNMDIDLILMDLKMPEMDGYEATRQIRQFNKEVLIIAQSSYALSGDHEKGIEAGCNYYLDKPISFTDLILLIKEHFSAKS